MAEQITLNFKNPIALFPLPGTVLLPHSVLPLHIFEDRYRTMVHDALDSAGLIAMALFEGDVDDDDYARGQPPLREHVCVGYIERYEALDDGRYLLLLRGLCRARIEQETTAGTPYRTAVLNPTEYPPADDDALLPQREALQRGLDDPALARIEGLQELRDLFDKDVPTVGLIDLMISMLEDDVDTRYTMLAESNGHRRAAFCRGRLADLRRSARSAGRSSNGD
jgi:ATP-dependent Lon protease